MKNKREKVELTPENEKYLKKQIKRLIISSIVLVVLLITFFILKAIGNN